MHAAKYQIYYVVLKPFCFLRQLTTEDQSSKSAVGEALSFTMSVPSSYQTGLFAANTAVCCSAFELKIRIRPLCPAFVNKCSSAVPHWHAPTTEQGNVRMVGQLAAACRYVTTGRGSACSPDLLKAPAHTREILSDRILFTRSSVTVSHRLVIDSRVDNRNAKLI
jgi:hypothetical protein